VKEIEAAQSAGMQSLLCVRKEHPTPTSSAAGLIHDFSSVFPD